MFDTVTVPAKQILNAAASTTVEVFTTVETGVATVGLYAGVARMDAQEFSDKFEQDSSSRLEVAKAKSELKRDTQLMDIDEERYQLEKRKATLEKKRAKS